MLPKAIRNTHSSFRNKRAVIYFNGRAGKLSGYKSRFPINIVRKWSEWRLTEGLGAGTTAILRILGGSKLV